MKSILLALSIVLVASVATQAQKIAFADVNAILSVMPENKKINEDLQIYGTGLQKKLDDMKGALDGMVKEFQAVLAAGDTAKALEIQKMAIKADTEFQQAAKQAEQQLGQKRTAELQPVLVRIREAMEAVAKKDGFEYILNSMDGSGTSIVLWGPEGHDVTRKVVDELGIKLQQPESAPAKDAKNKK